jgi:hypothetical protein
MKKVVSTKTLLLFLLLTSVLFSQDFWMLTNGQLAGVILSVIINQDGDIFVEAKL